MSLIRQVWLLVLFTVLTSFAGGFAVSVHTAREYMRTQLTLKNNDSAMSLGMLLSQQHGDPTAIELLMAAQFDTGFYERLVLRSQDGKVLVDRAASIQDVSAPAWFVRLTGLQVPPGVAQVSDGWRPIGRVEVSSQRRFSQEQMWQGALTTAAVLGVLGALSALVGGLMVQVIRRPLDDVVDQATAISQRRFVSKPLSRVPELRRVTGAMNDMVERLRTVFDQQAREVERLRREATCDPVTGAVHRTHFLAAMAGRLDAEHGRPSGSLVLVRVGDRGSANARIGRLETDRLLHDIGQLLAMGDDGHPAQDARLVGRLNGSDFGLFTSGGESPALLSDWVAARLRSLLVHPAVSVRIAAAGWQHGQPSASLLAVADEALARAEARAEHVHEPVVTEVVSEGDADAERLACRGEQAWRMRLLEAIAERHAELAAFKLIDARGRTLHLECPMRLRLDGPAGELVRAARWLPMARRTRLVGQLDALATELALQAIEDDGAPRCINLAPASLADPTLLPRLRQLLQGRPDQVRSLWIDVAEPAALLHFELLHELCMQLHPLGVRIGLEHAVGSLTGVTRLMELGIDYVKLEAATVTGVGRDAAQAGFVAGLARMLHGLGLQVYAEGVTNGIDAQQIFECGLDGLTGPFVA